MFLLRNKKGNHMEDFSKVFGDLLAAGETLESAFRTMARGVAKEAIERFMESEMTAYLGYSKYDHRNGDNTGDSRNGKTERTIATSVGPITVSVPRDRNGGFRTAALPRYQRKTEVITSAIIKLYSAGMTDDEMRAVIESIYDAKVSRSYVSSVTDAVIEDVEEFRKAPMPSEVFCLYLDSTYVPLRRGTVQKEAVNIAMAVTAGGERVVLGYSITPEESAEAYGELLGSFAARGLRRVEVVVSDGIPGLDDAIEAHFPKARRQRCFVHLMRNLCSKARAGDRREIAADFMAVAKAEDKAAAATLLGGFNGKWGSKYPAIRRWCLKAEDVLTFMDFPKEVRRLIYTNNPIESLNKQIKRGLKKQIQFVTEEALEKRLVTMFLHFNMDPAGRKVRGWRTIVDLMAE